MKLQRKAKFFLYVFLILMLITVLASCTGASGDTTEVSTGTSSANTEGRIPNGTTAQTPADSTGVPTVDSTNTPTTSAPTTTAVTEAPKPAVGNPSAIGYPSNESDTLPILSIDTENGEDIVSRDEYMNAVISVSGTLDDEVYGFEELTSEVRCRGNYTYTGTDKKSYRLKFTEKINLFGQGYGPAKSWVLLANHCDQTFLRNHVAFTIARNLSNIDYCSSSSFVKLYINGKYYGIYQVAEQHQVNRYRVNIDEDPDAVNTDYLVERDSYADDAGEEGIHYFRINRTKYRVHSDYMTEEKCDYLQKFFQEAHDAIKNGSRVTIERYIDIDSMIDTFILQALTKNMDVGYSSFFMVKKANDKIYFTCPWDFDLSQGNDERLDNGSYEGLYVGVKTGVSQEHEWFYLLMNETWFCDRLLARWNEVKSTVFDAALSEVTRILACFEDDMETNFDVWKLFSGRLNPQINQEPREIRSLKTYKEQVLYLENWLNSRYKYLDDLLNSEALYQQGGFESNGGWYPGGWW